MPLRPRDYQLAWMAKTREARANGFSRLLLDAVGGSGKTTYAGALALEAWTERQGRTLILENRDQLVRQTAKRFQDETGLETDIEMGKHRASPHSPLVVASVASLGRIDRLTGFAPNHFEYVFADEAHNSTANLFLRIMRYFHYGAASLNEEWPTPKDGEYTPLATVIGITATPDNHGKRNLGNFYQKVVDRYSYLQAIEDGWLVGLKEINIPVKIDTRKFRRKATGHGMDFSAEDETAAIVPVIEELAAQIVTLAGTRKTMCYLPSKECVELMAESLNRRGLKAVAVTGDSLEKNEDTELFYHHGPGIVMVLCAMYVEGSDFPTVDTVAWMRATESPSYYKQGIFRCSRALPGLVNDEMGAEGRKAAIAASSKPWSMVISPFFISDRIDIMSVVDLFVDPSIKNAGKVGKPDFTKPASIRDHIAALEKAADKHANRQARTVDPIGLSVTLRIPEYRPDSSADAGKPTRQELDTLLSFGVDTSNPPKTSGEAQAMIAKLRVRKEQGLYSPKVLKQMMLRFGIPEERAVLMKAGQAGLVMAGKIPASAFRPKPPALPTPEAQPQSA